ncbi:MAG: ChaN family lipoprotein, partial [Pseudomonadota bacterium]
PDWSIYRPVFEAVGDATITGGGVSRADLNAAIRGGASAPFGAGAGAAGLDEALDPETQAALEAEMIAAHCDALPAAMAPGMVEAQRLRDARFATAVLRAIDARRPPTVLVTGNGHARSDRGVPFYLARLAPERRVLSLGQIEVRISEELIFDYLDADGGAPFDYLWFSGGVPDRGDPCAVFRKG